MYLNLILLNMSSNNSNSNKSFGCNNKLKYVHSMVFMFYFVRIIQNYYNIKLVDLNA